MNKSVYRIKANTAGLRILSLERLGCKAGPWLESGNLNEKVPYTDKTYLK